MNTRSSQQTQNRYLNTKRIVRKKLNCCANGNRPTTPVLDPPPPPPAPAAGVAPPLPSSPRLPTADSRRAQWAGGSRERGAAARPAIPGARGGSIPGIGIATRTESSHTGAGATPQAPRGAAGAANSMCCAGRRGGGVGGGRGGRGGRQIWGDGRAAAMAARRHGGGARRAEPRGGGEGRAVDFIYDGVSPFPPSGMPASIEVSMKLVVCWGFGRGHGGVGVCSPASFPLQRPLRCPSPARSRHGVS
jgi:hypothetical protein